MLASPASPVASRACCSSLFSFASHVNGIEICISTHFFLTHMSQFISGQVPCLHANNPPFPTSFLCTYVRMHAGTIVAVVLSPPLLSRGAE